MLRAARPMDPRHSRRGHPQQQQGADVDYGLIRQMIIVSFGALRAFCRSRVLTTNDRTEGRNNLFFFS